jgi:hypothetical protein
MDHEANYEESREEGSMREVRTKHDFYQVLNGVIFFSPSI